MLDDNTRYCLIWVLLNYALEQITRTALFQIICQLTLFIQDISYQKRDLTQTRDSHVGLEDKSNPVFIHTLWHSPIDHRPSNIYCRLESRPKTCVHEPRIERNEPTVEC